MSETEGVYIDQSQWGHIALTGEDRVRFLNGMVTGNISSMAEGDWLRTLMLSHKARILSIFDVQCFADHLLLSCPAEALASTMATIDKHIVMDDVELESRTVEMHTHWRSAADVWTAAPVLAVCPQAPDPEAAEVLRIEAGMPRYGVDVDEGNFPFESTLVRLVDYDKGCFTGQEPVARVHARGGGGSKKLLGLRYQEPLLEPNTLLDSGEKKGAVRVTSSVQSPRFGAISLAYVHKSAWEAGSQVQSEGRHASVVGLPFTDG